MERNMKRCCTSSRLLRPYCADRLTSLPDELLGRILSLLPTKDVAAVQVLSKRMRPVFSWLTSIYLDDSSLRECYQQCPLLAQRLPRYEAFIDNVLDKLHHNQSLTRFKLRLGGDFFFRCFRHHNMFGQFCYPYVKPTRFNRWICYPLANCGLRELHLSFYVENPSECKLPPQILDCPSLEVLCLDSNIEIRDGVEFQRICLPKLKILHMHSLVFNESDFITRLVSSCHALEELVITYRVWKKLDRMAIYSDSLRKLVLHFVDMIGPIGERPHTNVVLINTPNLKYLKYIDSLSHRYSIPHLNALVEAHIGIYHRLAFDPKEASARIQLSLLSALSNVQHLSLCGSDVQVLQCASELNDQLLVFRCLKTLELGAFDYGRWDIALLLILRLSPFLETLVFPLGFFNNPDKIYFDDSGEFVLEAEGGTTSKLTPSCFLTHLKRIELKKCFGYERELNMIKFLVSKALVLREFVTRLTKETGCIHLGPNSERIEYDGPDLDEFKRTLDNLPTASDSCSIIVSR